MCGIVGTIGECSENQTRRMIRALSHRGPDAQGFHFGAKVHLASSRLSIVGLGTEGNQPIYNEDRSKCVVLNGEIYNFRTLRDKLELRGHIFRSRTDTEVLVHLYEEYGADCAQYCEGMFAFAITDGDRVIIARDRFGIKPLYYTYLPEKRSFVFASEVKALLQHDNVRPRVNEEALANRLLLGFGTVSETSFKDIHTLPAGHIMFVEAHERGLQVSSREFGAASLLESRAGFSESSELLDRLDQSVERHLMGDTPIAVSLSGGLDSTLIALSASKLVSGKLKTYCIAESETHEDFRQARAIARHLDSDHREIVISFEDYVEAIPAFIATEEQPGSLRAMPSLLLAKEIGRTCRVCLSGEGADELFGGYSEYLSWSGYTERCRAALRRVELSNLPVSESLRADAQELIQQVSYADYLRTLFRINLGAQLVKQHLEPLDRFGMAYGVEARVPFLDDAFAAYALSLPLFQRVRPGLGVGKYALKVAAVARYGSAVTDVVLRKKLGFPDCGLTHLRRFMQLAEALPSEYAEEHRYARYFTRGTEDGAVVEKYRVLLFDLFEHIFVDHRGMLPPQFDMMTFLKDRARTCSVTMAVANE